MKKLSSPFAVLATAFSANEFQYALVRVSALYVGIIALVIGFFTYAIISEVQGELEDISFVRVGESTQTVLLSRNDALLRAQEVHPHAHVVTHETELENGEVVTGVIFTDDVEVKVNHRTGDAHIEASEVFTLSSLVDDMDEMIISIALVVFVVSSAGAVFLARIILTPIRENMRMHERFVADTAHELRNPLTAVHLALESLRRSPPQSEAVLVDELTKIGHEHQRLIDLSENILALADAGRRDRRSLSLIYPYKGIEEVARQLAGHAQQKQVTLKTHIEEVSLVCNEGDFIRMVYNLVDNAIKFSKKGGEVLIRFTKDKVLEVADAGNGMSATDREHMFERFYRADASRSAPGHGLGLSIVQGIADTYNATIEVESVLGEGTKVRVRFLQ